MGLLCLPQDDSLRKSIISPCRTNKCNELRRKKLYPDQQTFRKEPHANMAELERLLRYQPVEKWRSDQLMNVSRSEAPLAFKTWITVLASENISLSQFVARQRFGRTGRERGCAASAACPVGLTSIFQRAAKAPAARSPVERGSRIPQLEDAATRRERRG